MSCRPDQISFEKSNNFFQNSLQRDSSFFFVPPRKKYILLHSPHKKRLLSNALKILRGGHAFETSCWTVRGRVTFFPTCFERREGNKMGGNCYVSSNWNVRFYGESCVWCFKLYVVILSCTVGALYNLGVKISGMLCKELDEENQQNTYTWSLTVRPWKVAGPQKERIVFQPSIFRGFHSLLNFEGVPS